MYNVKNVRHGQDLGKMDEKTILSKWPQADLSGKEFRAGKFIITCEPVRKKRAKKVEPKTEEENEG